MAELVRVARDKSAVILKSEGWYSVVSATNTVVETSDVLMPLLASGSWRRPVDGDEGRYAASILALNEVTPATRKVRPPKKISDIVGKDSLTVAEAFKLRSEMEAAYQEFLNLGGEEALTWARTVTTEDSLVAAGSFEPSETLVYIATSNTPDSTQIDSLFAVTSDNKLLKWTGKSFEEMPILAQDLDEPTAIEVDNETAKAIADWVEDGELDGFIDISTLDEEEKNLFDMAAGEMDWDLVDELNTIIAAAFYDNAKKTIHAERQERSPEGKFNGPQHEPGTKLTVFLKARIPDYYELTENPAARVEEYLANVQGTPVLLAAAAMPEVITEEEAPPAAEEAPPAEEEAPAPAAENAPLYMAIVDEVDRTAVLDIVAIIKDDTGAETSWIRQNSMWVESPEYLEKIRSDAPPTIVELTDEETIKDVLAQIDESDSGDKKPVAEAEPETGEAVTAAAFSKKQRETMAKKGYAMPSGSYPIATVADLKNAVHAYGRAKEEEKAAVRRHIAKRARALGHPELIPEDWEEASLNGNFNEFTSFSDGADFEEFSPERRRELAQKGFALSDGSFPILTVSDLQNALRAFEKVNPDDKDSVRNHIRKRARALGRADLLPESWAKATTRTGLSVEQLYGQFGEIYSVTAGGIPGVADTPEDFRNVQRLKNYWAYGRGAAKIRWGTPGDLTRCHRHLNKYMPGRSWSYCNVIHKKVFGIWNPESGGRKK